jgi:hypothetical protein
MGERCGGRVDDVERREEGVGERGRKVEEDGATTSVVEGRMRSAAPRGDARALQTPARWRFLGESDVAGKVFGARPRARWRRFSGESDAAGEVCGARWRALMVVG